jgi:hypothetical protein
MQGTVRATVLLIFERIGGGRAQATEAKLRPSCRRN